MNPNYYVFFDPGPSTGWARWGGPGPSEGRADLPFGGCGTLRGLKALKQWLEKLNPKPEVVGYEEYRKYPWVNHDWSPVETIQYIGVIEAFGEENNIRVVEKIPAMNKKMGYSWGGLSKPKKKAESHQADATAIGIWWLQKNGKQNFLKRTLEGKF